MKGRIVKRSDSDFDSVLDTLQEQFHGQGGGPEAEVIVNWSKQQVKEDGTVSFFATNSSVSSAIKRCRPGIVSVLYTGYGVELTFDSKYVRPMHTVLKVAGKDSD